MRNHFKEIHHLKQLQFRLLILILAIKKNWYDLFWIIRYSKPRWIIWQFL